MFVVICRTECDFFKCQHRHVINMKEVQTPNRCPKFELCFYLTRTIFTSSIDFVHVDVHFKLFTNYLSIIIRYNIARLHLVSVITLSTPSYLHIYRFQFMSSRTKFVNHSPSIQSFSFFHVLNHFS